MASLARPRSTPCAVGSLRRAAPPSRPPAARAAPLGPKGLRAARGARRPSRTACRAAEGEGGGDEKDTSLDTFMQVPDAAKSGGTFQGEGKGGGFSKEQVTAIVTGVISIGLAAGYLTMANVMDSRDFVPAVMDLIVPPNVAQML